MLDELILKDETRRHLDGVLADPKQSYMFVGPRSVGKFTSALHLAAKIIKPKSKDEEAQIKEGRHQDVIIVRRIEDSSSIKIDQIHDLQRILKLKATDNQHRVAIIKNAHHMTRPAQNSLLKLFEEVPQNTIIFLTTNQQQKIISTIHSRAYHIPFHIPNKENVQDLIKKLDKELRELVEAFEIRNPGILYNLAVNDTDYAKEWQNIYNTASDIIHGNIFEKMALINATTNDHKFTENILDAIGVFYRNALLTNNSSIGEAQEIADKLSAVEKAKHHFAYNVNHKLAMSNLMLNL